MRTTTLIILWVVRLAGIAQLALGLLIWAGLAAGAIALHIRIGFLIVLCLWIMAAMALVTRASLGLAVFALLWGIALPAFGLAHAAILVGPMHWIVRVVHLLMGIAALGLADRLARGLMRARGAAPGVARTGEAGASMTAR